MQRTLRPSLFSTIFEKFQQYTIKSDEFRYCWMSVKNTDEGYFHTCRLARIRTRHATFTIRAFGIELDKAFVRDETVANSKFQFWKENIYRIYDNEMLPRPHPVANELLKIVKKHNIPEELLINMIVAREINYKNKGINTMVEFKSYAQSVHEGPYLFLLHVLGDEKAEDENLKSLAYNVGQCEAVMATLRKFKKNSRIGIVNIPKTIMYDHGLGKEDLIFRRGIDLISSVTADMLSYGRNHVNMAKFQTISGKLLPLPERMIFTTIPIINKFYDDCKVNSNIYSSEMDNVITWKEGMLNLYDTQGGSIHPFIQAENP